MREGELAGLRAQPVVAQLGDQGRGVPHAAQARGVGAHGGHGVRTQAGCVGSHRGEAGRCAAGQPEPLARVLEGEQPGEHDEPGRLRAASTGGVEECDRLPQVGDGVVAETGGGQHLRTILQADGPSGG